jgi:Bacteriophage related domain of unknown function
MVGIVVVVEEFSVIIEDAIQEVTPVGLEIIEVVSETVSLVEATTYRRSITKILDDVVSAIEAKNRRKGITKVSDQTESITDAANQLRALRRITTETVSIAEAITKYRDLIRILVELEAVNEAALYIRGLSVVVSEVESLVDSAVHELTVTTAGGYEAMSNAVRSRFKTNVEDAIPITVQYSNEVETPPEDAAWIRFDVIHTDTDLLAVGGTNRFRKNAEARARIFTPIEQGDEETRQIADTIIAAFAHVKAGGVQYRSPWLQQPRREGKWWVVDVVIPLYVDTTEQRPAGSLPTLTMNKENVGDVLRSWFNTQITLGVPIPTAWDNAPFSPPEDSKWVRMTILEAGARSVGGGAQVRYRTDGQVRAQIFVPHGEGDFDALGVSDQITATFRGNNIGGVHFSMPSLRTLGRDRGTPWYQLNVSCPFSYDMSTA